jgi:signal transduction histidine kinase
VGAKRRLAMTNGSTYFFVSPKRAAIDRGMMRPRKLKPHIAFARVPFLAGIGGAPKLRLFQRYAALFIAVVCAALLGNGALDIWFSFGEQKTLLFRIQREQATAAALRMNQFIHEVEGQLAWATQLPWSTVTKPEWDLDVTRMLRQVPAITEVIQLDAAGHAVPELRRTIATSNVGDGATDFSQNPAFTEAVAKRDAAQAKHSTAPENAVYYGPVTFHRESEPYMTLAMAGVLPEYGVIVAQVNLASIWEVVSAIRVGDTGTAYVVGPADRLIAHPDISKVLRNSDMSGLAQVRAARASGGDRPSDEPVIAQDIDGRQVLSAHALVDPLGWLVFVDLPVDEAYAPIYGSILRSGAFVLGAVVLAALAGLYLAHRMTKPIRALHVGAARIGQGDLAHRIAIETGDELETLGREFNQMATRLQESYATLEHKVKERTQELELANQELELANLGKSRFLATASHDLRQPLHALGLFIAQLRTAASATEQSRVIERVDAAITNMNDLFRALLDLSKLDAGAVPTAITEFPVADLLQVIDTTFARTAQEAGLELRVLHSKAWVRSDFSLLEQVLLNLVSNAVRYVRRGGVVVGCRKRGATLRIEVWDSGPGIAEDQREKIFEEFYRINNAQRQRSAGLGLGLAIVERTCRLLDHRIELASRLGRGSRFTVIGPLVAAGRKAAPVPAPAATPIDPLRGMLAAIIDDDPESLDGTGGLLRSWGCGAVIGRSVGEMLMNFAPHGRPPDMIISDYRLSDEETGIEAVTQLREVWHSEIPAVIVSGDISPELASQAKANNCHLLQKPASPIRMRALLTYLIKPGDAKIHPPSPP